MSVPKLTLTYFPIAGRAEPIRLAAAAGKIPFTNHILSFPEFMAKKESFPFGQVPVLEMQMEDGSVKSITQSNAILRYVGKLGGLYPTNEIQAMEVDEILDILDDMAEPIRVSVRGAVRTLISETEFTDEEKLAIRTRWMSKFPLFLEKIESKLVASSSGWVIGSEKVTIADIAISVVLTWIKSGILDGIPTSVLDKFPACLALIEKVANVEGIKKWKETYSMPYASTFDFVPEA